MDSPIGVDLDRAAALVGGLVQSALKAQGPAHEGVRTDWPDRDATSPEATWPMCGTPRTISEANTGGLALSYARSPVGVARRLGTNRSALAFSSLVLIRIALQGSNAAAVITRLGSHRPAHGVSPRDGVAPVIAGLAAQRPGRGLLRVWLVRHGRLLPSAVCPLGGPD